jgi:hypothetical protein
MPVGNGLQQPLAGSQKRQVRRAVALRRYVPARRVYYGAVSEIKKEIPDKNPTSPPSIMAFAVA